MKLRDDLKHRLEAGEAEDTAVTLTVPLRLAGYIMAAVKHLGDTCMTISKMGADGELFQW